MSLTQEQITTVFQTVLRRDPRPQEIRIWITEGHTPRILTDAVILQATEPRSIIRLYLSLFAGYPDGLDAPYTGQDGLTYWISSLRGLRNEHPGISYKSALQHTIIDWFDTEPHRAVYGSGNTCNTFADVLCAQALGRPPTEAESKEWGNIKDGGNAAKAKLAVELSESRDCKLRFNGQINDRLRKLALASCSL